MEFTSINIDSSQREASHNKLRMTVVYNSIHMMIRSRKLRDKMQMGKSNNNENGCNVDIKSAKKTAGRLSGQVGMNSGNRLSLLNDRVGGWNCQWDVQL